MELFNSWDLSADKKPSQTSWSQGALSLEELIAKLWVLVKEANYPAEHHERFLRDFLVFGMNSHRVRKDCFKKINTLSFNKAREMAKAEEPADKQLQLMYTAVEVHPVTS